MEENKEQEVPDKIAVFTIIMDKQGNIDCQSPFLNDKTSCYGLLESAKDFVREFNKSRVIKSGSFGFLKNGRH